MSCSLRTCLPEQLVTAALVVAIGGGKWHEVLAAALPKPLPAAGAVSGQCAGAPIAAYHWFANGECNQATGDLHAVCESLPGNPSVCSYKMAVVGTTEVNFGGLWAGADCKGSPVSPGGLIPVDACLPSSGFSFKFILMGPEHVDQDLFLGGSGIGRHDTGNVPQSYRPPQLTVVQNTVIQQISDRAAALSPKAEAWVLQHLGSPAVRTRLDPTLQHYSDEQLMAMLSWEFPRLPLLHNAPVDDLDAERGAHASSPNNQLSSQREASMCFSRRKYTRPEA
eukprot:COSAG02_NODE_2392_length_8974_cov_2.135437_5_plen_280_part_00